MHEAKLSGACLDYYSSWGPELKALWISLAKLSDWHRMDECSLRQSSVAGHQSRVINGPLRWKQMPPLLYGWFRWSSQRTSTSHRSRPFPTHQNTPVSHLLVARQMSSKNRWSLKEPYTDFFIFFSAGKRAVNNRSVWDFRASTGYVAAPFFLFFFFFHNCAGSRKFVKLCIAIELSILGHFHEIHPSIHPAVNTLDFTMTLYNKSNIPHLKITIAITYRFCPSSLRISFSLTWLAISRKTLPY